MKPKRNKTRSQRRKGKTGRAGASNMRPEGLLSNQLPDPQNRPVSSTAESSTNNVEGKSPPKKVEDKLVESSGRRVTKKFALIFSVFGGIAAAVGFFGDVGGFYSKWQNRQPIDVGIAWYEKKNDSLQLVSPDAVVVDLRPEDVFNGRVSIPVNLAIENKEAEPLEVVRVELSYDKSLKVESNGRTKIDPGDKLLIYEHSFGTLQSLGFYTPLETIDVIQVPFEFHVFPVIARSKDGVPFYLVTIIGYEGKAFADKIVQLGVKIYCKDRPALNGIIRLHLRATVQLIGLSEKAPKIVDLNSEDLLVFQEIPFRAQVEAHWKRRDSEEGFLVDYNKVKYHEGVYQYILVDGVIRRVNADTNSDGLVDYELYDSTGDGIPEKKVIPFPQEQMLDWTENGLK